jgi:hypothetical protein
VYLFRSFCMGDNSAPQPASHSRSFPPGASAARWTFLAVTAAILPVMVLASFDFGVTWDEKDRHSYGIKVWEFLQGLRDRSTFRETGGHVYPGLFDTLCAIIETWVPANRYVLRHVINATFGWVGVVYGGRLAARMFGPWCGVLAAVLLALSPRYFAGSMNNPKDLPFAAMSVMALYYISTVSPRWPYVSIWKAVKITVSLALALNIRVGGLLYLGYFGLLIAALVILERQTNWRRLADTTARVSAISLGVLLLGTVFWPWAGGAPLTRPFEALLGAAGYPWEGYVLFAGYEYEADELPWLYAPWWFVISTPPIVLIGAVFSAVFARDRTDALRRLGLWATFIFPIATAIIMESTLYDSVRHLMFAYPILVVLGAGGLADLIGRERPRWMRAGAAVAIVAGIVSLTVFNVRFHPNQGVYFNSLVGGPGNAFKRYDMDYWGNCILQGVEWAAGVAESFDTTVTITGSPGHVVLLDAERFPRVRFSQESENRHHMYIDMARGLRDEFRKLATQPALHRVTTPDGAVLCSITVGPAYRELGAQSSGTRPQANPE